MKQQKRLAELMAEQADLERIWKSLGMSPEVSAKALHRLKTRPPITRKPVKNGLAARAAKPISTNDGTA